MYKKKKKKYQFLWIKEDTQVVDSWICGFEIFRIHFKGILHFVGNWISWFALLTKTKTMKTGTPWTIVLGECNKCSSFYKFILSFGFRLFCIIGEYSIFTQTLNKTPCIELFTVLTMWKNFFPMNLTRLLFRFVIKTNFEQIFKSYLHGDLYYVPWCLLPFYCGTCHFCWIWEWSMLRQLSFNNFLLPCAILSEWPEFFLG